MDNGALQRRAVKLEQSVHKRTVLLELLHEVAAHCHKAGNLEEALDYVLRAFCRFDGWCFGHAFRPDPEHPHLLVPVQTCYAEAPKRFRAFRKATRDLQLRRGQGLPGRVWRKRQPHYVSIGRFRAELHRRTGEASDLGIRTAAAFPVLYEGGLVAVLEFFSDRNMRPEQGIFQVMNTIGGQLALVEARDQSQRAVRLNEARLRRLVDSNIAGVFMADDKGKVFEANPAFLKLTGFSRTQLEAGRLNWRRQTPPEDRDQNRLLLRELRERGLVEPRESRFLRQDGIRVPVLLGMAELNPEGRERHWIAFVVDLSDLRRLERQILEISDYEKQQLGQDLHDGLSQQISGIKFQMGSLANNLNKQSHPRAAQAQGLVQLLAQAEEAAHDLARGLHPIRQEKTGLADALESLAESMHQLYQKPCEFDMRRMVFVPDPHVALHLYRIAQEAVGNSMRHGQPRRVMISLAQRSGSVLLEVRDDGAGFASPTGRAGGRSMGLDIMRYRARLIGAKLKINSEPGQGTSVQCVWPRPKQ